MSTRSPAISHKQFRSFHDAFSARRIASRKSSIIFDLCTLLCGIPRMHGGAQQLRIIPTFHTFHTRPFRQFGQGTEAGSLKKDPCLCPESPGTCLCPESMRFIGVQVRCHCSLINKQTGTTCDAASFFGSSPVFFSALYN